MILSKMKRLMAYTSKSRYIRYLRDMGMVIGEYILRRHRVGGNAKRYAEILQNTEQLYPDYRAFLMDALGEDVVKGEMKKDFPKE